MIVLVESLSRKLEAGRRRASSSNLSMWYWRIQTNRKGDWVDLIMKPNWAAEIGVEAFFYGEGGITHLGLKFLHRLYFWY